MNERIKALRKYLKLNQSEFASKLGLNQSSISMIESGENTPSPGTIKSICTTFGCSELWLRTGEGEMFAPIPDDEKLIALMAEIVSGGDANEIAFARRLLTFSHRHWPELRQLLEDQLEETSAGK